MMPHRTSPSTPRDIYMPRGFSTNSHITHPRLSSHQQFIPVDCRSKGTVVAKNLIVGSEETKSVVEDSRYASVNHPVIN